MNNPIDPARILETVALAEAAPGSLAVDLGCGDGELLAALGRRGWRGHGVEQNAALVQAADVDGVELVVGDARTAALPAPITLLICVGATHAFGAGAEALTGALNRARAVLSPGAYLLIGEGYQLQPLPGPYQALLGPHTGIERTHVENVRTCEQHGFQCLHAITASQAEWDAFEWRHHRKRVARAEALGEPARPEGLAQALRWRDGYLRWGRQTMGFGLYLLQR